MAQIQKGTTFTSGGTVTDTNLNNHVDNATLLAGAITEQNSVPSLTSGNQFLVEASGLLKRVTAGAVFAAAPPIGSTTPNTVAATTLTASGLATVGSLTSTGLATAGSLSVGGTSAHTGAATFASTAAFTGAATFDGAVSGTGVTPAIIADKPNTSTGYIGIPSGTTGQRPASPADGNTRYNSTLAVMEYYTGSAWQSIPQGVAAKAWVNFDGTRDASGATSSANTNRFIRASANVASVLRHSAADFTISFTTPMVDANYAVAAMHDDDQDGASGNFAIFLTASGGSDPTSGAFRIVGNVSYNASVICATVFR